jgi:hypothetical protein
VSCDPEDLRRLGRESGRMLAELGVRSEDSRWISMHAETIASLAGQTRRRRFFDYLLRWARRAARTVR